MSQRVGEMAAPHPRHRRGIHYDPDRFGRFSEAIARFLGTATYLVGQTILVIVWIAINVTAVRLRWDPYPFILLNLLFSTQASYAAPLILLAQTRQAERDRATGESDREVNARTLADAEDLRHQLDAIRVALAQLATADDVAARLDRLDQQVATVASQTRPT